MSTHAPSLDHPGWIGAIRTLSRRTALVRSGVTGLIMMGIVVDVARRATIGRSIPGMVELVETFLALEVFLGLAHAEAEGVHVRMTLATDRMPYLVRRAVKSFGMFICMLGSVWFTWGSVLRAIEATAVGEVKPGLLRFPVWPARWVIAIGFAVLVAEYLARTWEEWHAQPAEPASDVDLPIEVDAVVKERELVDQPGERIVETLDRLNSEEDRN